MLCGSRERTSPDSLGVLDTGARADSLYFASRPELALKAIEEALSAGVDDTRLRWRAARAAIAVGMLLPDGPERRASYDCALRHARRAVDLAPADLTARYWLAAAAGRRVHRSDPVYSARLGREIFEHLSAILAADSTDAGAHHAMGMLHAGVLRIPRVVRFVVARVVRSDLLGHANLGDAERHLRRAVDLQPEMILYLVDLAELYRRMGGGREHDADSLAARLAMVPSRHPMDDALRSIAVARLQRAEAVRRE